MLRAANEIMAAVTRSISKWQAISRDFHVSWVGGIAKLR
jgi:hypothetical protein